MPKKEQTPDRPRDMNQLAQRIVTIATGEVEDSAPEPVSPDARKRGEARAANLSPAKREKIAEKAAQARWGKR